ncbi:MAG: 2-oxo acid dehydrogenase subunit E2 [Bacillota bacterium]
MEKTPYALFRKASLSIWNKGGDPSVYGFLDWDVTDLPKSVRTATLIKALGVVIKSHPDLNSILRWGRLRPRDTVDVTVMVNIPGVKNDLSFSTLRDVDQKSLEDISDDLKSGSAVVRGKKDRNLHFALQILNWMPSGVGRLFLSIYGLLAFDFGWDLRIFRLPFRPFGPVILSNIGSLGLKQALIPLVPMTRSCMMVSMGAASKEPSVREEQIVIREVIKLGVTFDHRYFDGSHAAQMLKDFQSALAMHGHFGEPR